LHFGFAERQGLIGYLDRISAGLMALADSSIGREDCRSESQ